MTDYNTEAYKDVFFGRGMQHPEKDDYVKCYQFWSEIAGTQSSNENNIENHNEK